MNEEKKTYGNQFSLGGAEITATSVYVISMLDEYTKFTRTTVVYPKDKALEYLALGLISEAGEVAGKIKKFIRGDDVVDFRASLILELGDVLWYIARLIDEISVEDDYTLESVFYSNMEKLSQRKNNNTINGDGDER